MFSKIRKSTLPIIRLSVQSIGQFSPIHYWQMETPTLRFQSIRISAPTLFLPLSFTNSTPKRKYLMILKSGGKWALIHQLILSILKVQWWLYRLAMREFLYILNIFNPSQKPRLFPPVIHNQPVWAATTAICILAIVMESLILFRSMKTPFFKIVFKNVWLVILFKVVLNASLDIP